MTLMLMMNMLTIMTMMMILMMIFDDDLYKILKTFLTWAPDLGTSPGHKPIIDQSCEVVFLSR